MFAIFRNEIGQFFASPVAYIIMATFLTATGLLLWVFPDTSLLDYGYADLGPFFTLVPYVLLFLVPAITMRSLAEERRNGTLEWLLTKPVSRWAIVLGKFWANWGLVALTLLPTLLYVITLWQLGNPPGNLDGGAVAGGYVGLLLLAAVLTALGLWCSALTEGQVVAFVAGVFGGFLGYVALSAAAQAVGTGFLAQLLDYVALDEQYRALGRGLIDVRNVLYLGSVTFLFLYLTQRQLVIR